MPNLLNSRHAVLLFLCVMADALEIPSFVLKSFDVADESPEYLTYYDGWDCSDPYGLSGIDVRSLREVYASPDSTDLKLRGASGCLDVSKKNEIISPSEFDGTKYYAGKVAGDSGGKYRCTGATNTFLRLGNEICIGVECDRCECAISGKTSYICASIDTGVARWNIGKCSGYFLFSKPSRLPYVPDLEPLLGSRLDAMRRNSRRYFFDTCSSRSLTPKAVCGSDRFYFYSLDSLATPSGNEMMSNGMIVLEISDGRKIRIIQKYYHVSYSVGTWLKPICNVYIDPVVGPSGLLLRDSLNDRAIILNRVGVLDDESDSIHTFSQFSLFRVLAPLNINDSLCFFYWLNTAGFSPRTICMDANQKAAHDKFRNIEINVTRY